MKNLKFRIYDKDKKGFHYLDSIFNMPDPCYDGEVQQWTGLVDRLGKEIYEGDLLLSSWPETSRVMFIDYGFKKCFWDYANDRWMPEPLGENEEEIIGNIYENPELVKETK